MQLGRKKKRENLQLEDADNSNDLFKNKSLLEYQNRCLASKIQDLNEKLNEKSNYANLLEKRFVTFSQVFVEFNLGLHNLNEELKKIIYTNKINLKGNSIDAMRISSPIEALSGIIKDITEYMQDKSSDSLNEQLKTLIDGTTINIIEIVNNLISTITYEYELKQILENNTDELEMKIFEGLSRENKLIKAKNEELLSTIQATAETHKKIFRKLQMLEAEHLINLEQLKQQSQEITQLKSKNFSLTRKLNTNPALPYIIFEKELLGKKINSHQCICHICGNEINTSEACENMDLVENIENVVIKDENNIDNSNNENILALTCENENLKLRIAELIEANEKIKMDNVITENKILSSKAFKSLYNQVESLLLQIDQLKEMNSDLQKQKFEISKEKENEVNNEERKFNEKRIELEKHLLDLNKKNESNIQTINNLNLKIETMDNLIKAKNSEEIETVFQNFDQEKQKWEKRLELIKQQKKEYIKKYEDEYSKNLSNEKLIIKLNCEIEKLRQNLSRYENSDKEEKYEKFDAKERDKMKRDLRRQEDKINLYEKNLKDLKTEIQIERENGEKLISELEVNEKGLDELNKKLKSSMYQLQESNEKMAKMTNEKIKDMHTIKLLNEEKEILEKRINEQEMTEEKCLEYRKKLESNQNSNKETIIKLEQELKFREEEIESVRNETKQISKISEQNRIAYEETLKALNNNQQSLIKSLANYEHTKAKYEELCKMKKLDTSLIGKSFEAIDQENEVLKLENDKYKSMVKCKVCLTRNKDVILLKCFHLFCKECIDGTIKSRHRICPACRESISTSDVHSIFLD